jgi:hypothetical protein
MANSTMAKVCNSMDKNGSNGEETNGIHGIALGICVEKDVDKSKFMMHAQMQTSYSEKRSVVTHQDGLVILHLIIHIYLS